MAVWSLQQPLIESYHEALVGCLIPFLELQPDLAEVIFKAIAAAWPRGFNSNTPKVRLMQVAIYLQRLVMRWDRSAAPCCLAEAEKYPDAVTPVFMGSEKSRDKLKFANCCRNF